MDALARLEPVARDLMRQVDTALATLGAPAEHPVWARLRRLGTTPADAVAFLVEVDAEGLRDAATTLRRQAEAHEAAEIPTDLPWRGAAGEAYAANAADLRRHGADLADRLRETAACAEEVADWSARSRDRLARALAEVLTSAQAVTVRSRPAENGPEAIIAAADIGARVLDAVAEAVAEGEVLHRRWQPALGEVPFRRTAATPPRLDATIEVGPA